MGLKGTTSILSVEGGTSNVLLVKISVILFCDTNILLVSY